MAYYDRHQLACLEALRKELFDNNRDIADRLTPGVPLLHTVCETFALIGIPIDLTLTQEELVELIWDLVEILHRRSLIVVNGAPTEAIADTILAVHDDLLSEVMNEYATGIIVNDDRIAEAPALEDKTDVKKEFTGLVNADGQTIH